MKRFELAHEITLADAAVRSFGRDLNELFMNTVLGLMNLLLENPDAVRPAHETAICLENDDCEMLLYDLLNEFLYLKETRGLYIPQEIEVAKGENGFVVECIIAGEPIDAARHNLRADIKAVTLHRFDIASTDTGYQALVVYDM